MKLIDRIKKLLFKEENVGIINIGDLISIPGRDYYIDNMSKFVEIEASSNEIHYNVIHTNDEKETTESKITFFTDCSEPLILSYVNEDVVYEADVSGLGQKLSLNGSILKALNIGLDSLNYKISFRINIENNLGDRYACTCAVNVVLDSGTSSIYSGNVMQIFDLSVGDYRFKKM